MYSAIQVSKKVLQRFDVISIVILALRNLLCYDVQEKKALHYQAKMIQMSIKHGSLIIACYY